jgi:hypothetical protein
VEKHELNQLPQSVGLKSPVQRAALAGVKNQSLSNRFRFYTGTESGDRRTMITAAPIRVLSNEVTIHTAAAVSEFLEICQAADPESGYIALPPWLQHKVVSVNKSMAQVAESQKGLILELEKVTPSQLESPSFQKVIADLERVVAQGESAISDTYSASETFVQLWQKNLDLVAEQNSHIDNYLESFRIAFDETCSALLADLATKVCAG